MKRVFIIILSLVVISCGLIACSSRQSIEDISQSSLSSSREESSEGEAQSAEPKNSETQSAEPEESSEALETSEPEYRDEIEIPAPSSSTSEISSTPSQTAADEPNKPQTANVNGEQPIAPWSYQALLGKGMDVDWSKTNQGRKYYNTQAAVDFATAGVSHVRIRIADKVSEELLKGLDRQIQDCLDNGIIPIIAYQADEFKNGPNEKNIKRLLRGGQRWRSVIRTFPMYPYIQGNAEMRSVIELLGEQHFKKMSAQKAALLDDGGVHLVFYPN